MDDWIAPDVAGARTTPKSRSSEVVSDRHLIRRDRWWKRIGKALVGVALIAIGVGFVRNGGVFDLLCGGAVILSGIGVVRRAL